MLGALLGQEGKSKTSMHYRARQAEKAFLKHASVFKGKGRPAEETQGMGAGHQQLDALWLRRMYPQFYHVEKSP